MPTNTTMKRHADLVDRMATTLGIDLEEKMLEGLIMPDGVCDAVLNCTGCANPDDCDGWLKAQVAPVDSVPDGCRNAEMFERLKAGKPA